MTKPFTGVKILDFTRVLAGPYGSYQLALLGADVVKVESREGDDMRYGNRANDWEKRGLAAPWVSVNAGKRSITLDLKKPKAIEVIKRLTAKADVVMENFRPGVMEKQARRMLADPRASSLVTSFAMKWLNLTTLDQVVPDPNLFRGFNEQLRRDFSTEAQAFIGSVFSEDRSVVELLTADYTFLNERLASHYGISGVTGPQFRKVTLTDNTRFGLLGKAAVQLRTSYGDRTSPVLRGGWVLDKLMGTPPTPPPPDTATDLSQKAGEQPKTVRARLEQHRDKASCRMCHGVIDPTGLALENFDAIGQWRTMDSEANAPIDAGTVLPTGVAINGPLFGPKALRNRLGVGQWSGKSDPAGKLKPEAKARRSPGCPRRPAATHRGERSHRPPTRIRPLPHRPSHAIVRAPVAARPGSGVGDAQRRPAAVDQRRRVLSADTGGVG
jgi:hypothetical protein